MSDAFLAPFWSRFLPWFNKNNPRHNDATATGQIDGDDVFMPVLWRDEPTMIAYSRNGYTNKTWKLPNTLNKANRLQVTRLSENGPGPVADVLVENGTITMSQAPNHVVMLTT
jgi:hypothetical protein